MFGASRFLAAFLVLVVVAECGLTHAFVLAPLAPGSHRALAKIDQSRLRCDLPLRGGKAKQTRATTTWVHSGAQMVLDVGNEPPVIDLSLLKKGEPQRESEVVQLIAEAASQWGFFQVVNHGVDADLIKDFDRATADFFALDKEEKYKVRRTSDNSRGYFDDELTKQTRDWKEAFDVGSQGGSLDAVSKVDGFNQWPEAPSEFEPLVRDYFTAVTDLSMRLLGVLAVGLDQPATFFDHHRAEHSSYLRLNHYPPCPSPVGAEYGLGSPREEEGFLAVNRHTDAGLLTVLRQKASEPNSLQVYMSEDLARSLPDSDAVPGRWVTVSPVEGAFTINVGDMMQVLSNDRYRAPLHRVLAHRERHRYSAPFFFNPPYAVDCTPMPSLGQPVYSVVNWGEFRRRRFEGDFADQGEEVQISQYRTAPAPTQR